MTVDIRYMIMDVCERIEKRYKIIKGIGYVCGQHVAGQASPVWVKVGSKQRIEELEKTRAALVAIECEILNDGFFNLPGCLKRVRRSASHIYGKGVSLTYKGDSLSCYDSNNIPF